jgi:ribosomal protein S18 acetylase RimI-like enzyme
MTLTIERAGAAQVDELAPLFDAYRQFYRLAPDPDAARDYLAARLAHGESVVFLARLGGAAAGFTQLYPSWSSLSLKRVWILYDLFVAPGARRQGAGAALLGHAREWAVESGASELWLETAIDNFLAQRLYERLGWRQDREYFRYYLNV